MQRILGSDLMDSTTLINGKPVSFEMLILTGGTTQIPLVQQSIRRLFPQAIISGGQRMESVALGLGYMAQKVFA